MVPDVAAILVKKNGIFCSPVSGKAPAKLRLVFECAPIAKIIETAGGKALSGRESGESVLDIRIQSMDDRVGIVCGSSDEVVSAVDSILVPTHHSQLGA
jgi:sedoheptulose-bisphosphatase